MTIAVVPLDDLAERIADRQSELESLRREYEARQARLTDLQRRKKDLESQLHAVESDMRAIAQGGKPKSTPLAGGKAAETPTLPHFLVDIVRAAGGPITIKAIATEVVRRRFPTTSRDIPNLVATRVRELVQKGALRRAEDQSGIVLGRTANGRSAATSFGKPQSSTGNGSGATQHKPTKKRKKRAGRKQPSLRSVLYGLLEKSRRPLGAQDLADQVLASGYRTKSKKFVDVLWVALGHMDGVENIKGKGYRLKRK